MDTNSEKIIYFLNKLRFVKEHPKLPHNRRIIQEFSKLFYNQSKTGGTWNATRWLGIRALKNPLDLFVYQEIIFEVKPDVVIETGTAFGGSALFLASILDMVSKGKVLTVEINKQSFSSNRRQMPKHRRIEYFFGSSTSQNVIERISARIAPGDKVMVILDSDHHKEHVLAEMKIYSQFVSLGSYLIVEDTNIGGHPVWEGYGPGPWEAVDEFLKDNKQSFSTNKSFIRDRSREKYLLTNNPGGFLKKIS